jgi:hypothetical protein
MHKTALRAEGGQGRRREVHSRSTESTELVVQGLSNPTHPLMAMWPWESYLTFLQ